MSVLLSDNALKLFSGNVRVVVDVLDVIALVHQVDQAKELFGVAAFD